MKKSLFLIICFFIFAPFVCCEETVLNESETIQNKGQVIQSKQEIKPDEQLKVYHSKYKKAKLKAKTSPKLEHLKTKTRAIENLETRKEEFQNRKENELILLQQEYEVLDSKP